jgi:hypothetical protein
MSTLTDIINRIDAITLRLRDLERPIELPRYRCLYVQTADLVVANTTTITSLVGTGDGITTLPAGFLTVGRMLRITARGLITTTGTPTLRIRLSVAGVTVSSTLLTMLTVSGVSWALQADIVTRAASTVYAHGQFTYDVNPQVLLTGGAVSVTLSSPAAIFASVQWGTANVLNTITCSHFMIEALN